MRALCLFCCLAFPFSVSAETISDEIGRLGLAPVEARLAALPAPADADRFALGGVRFLRAIEGTFQERWAMGMTDRTGMLPLLRLPLADNPNPAAFAPAAFVGIFAHAADRLTAAQGDLAAIPASSDFGLEISLDDIWFDVNSDGTRSTGEGIGDILGAVVTGGMDTGAAGAAPALPAVRFDVADAAWLAAYADLLNGVCAMIRAYDPTEPITRVMSARAAMEALGPVMADILSGGSRNPDTFDLIAMVLATLNQTPDTALMAQAQSHLLATVAQNREFWARVAVETDNDHEWLPSDQQTSALGIEVPKGAGTHWLAVLGDFEAVLKGQKLMPYWRVGAPAGINVAKIFTDPRPIDLAGWLQGWAALPYLEKGPLVSTENAAAFDRLTSGQAPLFAIYLN